MVFDIIVSVLAMGAVIKDACVRGQNTSNNRYTAQMSENPWYYDGNHKKRASDTNEIVCDCYHTGHHQVVGVKSGRVYEDWDQQQLDKKNNRLREKGKTRFIYVDYPQWKTKSGKRQEIRYDTVKRLPYMVIGDESYRNIPSLKHLFKPYIAYVDMNKSKYYPILDMSTKRKLTEEEYDMFTDNETGTGFNIKSGWR